MQSISKSAAQVLYQTLKSWEWIQKNAKKGLKRLKNENFFALILSGLRGCFFKNAVFACKMNFFEFFVFPRKIACIYFV